MKRSTVAAIDIGGTRSKIAVVDTAGRILEYDTVTTSRSRDPEQFLGELGAFVERFAAEGIKGIGISLPGFLTDDLRSIEFNPNTPSLEHFDFGAWLEQFGLPYTIEQDLNAAALGEHVFGAGVGTRRFIATPIGTGVGAGVIIDGEPLRFAGGTTGDSGHFILDPTGPPCVCGCSGCAEAFVGVAALDRAANEIAALDGVAELPDQDDSAAGLIAACRAGEPRSVAAIEAVGARLGQWLASLAPMFLPDRVALCGGIAEAGTPLLRACRESFLELAGDMYKGCEIVLGELGGRAGVVGAAVPLLLKE